MALDPKLLESLPDTLVDMYGLVEIDILSDMARRISTYDYFIPAAQHQNQKLQELGMMQNEIIARLSALTGKTQEEIVTLLSEASAQAIEDDIEYYTAGEVYEPSKVNTEALHKQLNSGLLQTEQTFFNITRTTANTATKQFEHALDRAWTQITSGAFDYNTAIKNAITDLSSQGLGAIQYKSGRIDNIEVAVRRAVVTGANQTAMKTQEVLADQLEVDLVETTAHGGARPNHAKWQGKVFSRKGRVTIGGVTYEDLTKATGYGSAGGLGGINCRHNFHPYVPGTSKTYSAKQLKDYDAKDIEYNGEKYTEYEASQIQRGIEREIRKQKRTIAALEAAGEDASEYRSKLRDAQKAYTDFTKQTGLKKQQARTQIGVGTRPAAPVTTVEPENPPALEKIVDATPSKTTEEPATPRAENREYKQLTLEEFKKMKHSVTKEERKIIYGKTHLSGYVNSSNARKLNEILRNGGTLPEEYQKIANTLQSVIDKNTINEDIMVVRYVAGDALESIAGVKPPVPSLKLSAAEYFQLVDEIPSKIEKGRVYTEKGFLSTSGVEDKNVMDRKQVLMHIKIPSGTHGYITTNNRESEIILGQNTNIRITDAIIQDSGTSDCKIVLECIVE